MDGVVSPKPAAAVMRRRAAAMIVLAAAGLLAAGPQPAAPNVLLARMAEAEMGPPVHPETVETGWDGVAACLAEPQSVDAAAAAGLRRLSRYSPPTSRRIRGESLHEQPRVLVEALADLTRAMPAGRRLATTTACDTVECIADATFGTPMGRRLLYLAVRYRYNASPLAQRGITPPTADQLQDVLLAVSDFPHALLPMPDADLRPIVLDATGEPVAAGGAVLALSGASREIGIRAQAPWSTLPRHMRRAIIFHELAHDWLRQQRRSVDADRIWRRAMAWDAAFQRNTGRPFGTVSRYAETSLDEDFAESAAAFRYAPRLILDRSPNRARLLRDWMFDGLSYESAASCAPGRARTERSATAARAALGDYEVPVAEVMAAVGECRRLLSDAASRHRVTRGRLCIAKAIYRSAFADQLARMPVPQPLPAAVVNRQRLANTPFIEEHVGEIDDADLLEITGRQRQAACGGSCHAR